MRTGMGHSNSLSEDYLQSPPHYGADTGDPELGVGQESADGLSPRRVVSRRPLVFDLASDGESRSETASFPYGCDL